MADVLADLRDLFVLDTVEEGVDDVPQTRLGLFEVDDLTLVGGLDVLPNPPDQMGLAGPRLPDYRQEQCPSVRPPVQEVVEDVLLRDRPVSRARWMLSGVCVERKTAGEATTASVWIVEITFSTSQQTYRLKSVIGDLLPHDGGTKANGQALGVLQLDRLLRVRIAAHDEPLFVLASHQGEGQCRADGPVIRRFIA
jgi:hypothetical protein